ncbi:MAG: hypothetical protein PHQ59_02820 [Candidatus Daviesbacteria bacterium]|nr:hypothetical protein [Candidatus Daviesbacteria bacterium]
MIFHNVSKISTLNFNNYFDTNAFYPNKNTLLFADSFIPQALLELPFYLVTKNLILSFNITFFIVLILNYLSTYLFWRKLFKNSFIAFFGSLFTIFSPAQMLEFSHFQMIFIWPFFFSLFFILKSQENHSIRNLTLAGIFLAIQFLGSVYLSFYLIFTIALLYFIEFITSKNYRFQNLRNIGIVFLVFIILNGYFIKNYVDTKKAYNIHHSLSENVTYSAHLTDYIFTSRIDSIIHTSEIANKWNSFNKNVSGGQSSFPGLLIFLLFLYSFFDIKKVQNKLIFRFDINKEQLLFTSLLFFGFLFSLGPRLNFNGVYAYIPTPYDLLLRIIPLVQEIRAPSRWYFIFTIGIIYFALLGIKKLQAKIDSRLLFIALLVIFFLEYVPVGITTHSETYINNHYITLKDLCSSKKLAVLEIPVTHLNAYPDIVSGLNYISKVQLASTYHQCYLINGYSSYDMPHLYTLSYNLYTAIIDNNVEMFIDALTNSKTDVVKFNEDQLPREVYAQLPSFIEKLSTKSGIKRLDNEMFIFESNLKK